MSITDELRAGGIYRFPSDKRVFTEEELTAIADRIDAEYAAKVSYWQGAGYKDWYNEGFDKGFAAADGWLAGKEDAIAEHGWVKLPVDADGEVIHLGDRVENNERVVRIVLTDGSWEPSVYVEKRPNVLHEYFCNEISHYHEPTVEDVLLDACKAYHGLMIEGMNDVAHDMPAPYEIIAEYAAKLRLASNEE